MTRRILSAKPKPSKLTTRGSRPYHNSPADKADFAKYVAEQVAACPPAERASAEIYFKSHPGHGLRQYKGKGGPEPAPLAQPGECPWQKLDAEEVRARATSALARDLPHNIRVAAANDPALIFNPLARRYRLRTASDA